jgi:L-2-amino-thiazoline-4-carboxylic acid hydrolase
MATRELSEKEVAVKSRSRKGSKWLLYFLGGMLVTWILNRSLVRKSSFPHINSVQKGLSEKYGELEAAFFVANLQQRYEQLFAERPRFSDHTLQTHVDELIIPVLALYQELLEKTGNSERSLEEVHDLMLQVVVGKSRAIVPLLGYFSDPFSILRRAVRLINRTVFPTAGWDIEYIQDNQIALAFKIHDCLFMNILAAYGVPELTKVFCKFDDDVAELFPKQILWKRVSTIARGAELCDFRYERALTETERRD